jgi:adenylate cyclase class 2
MKNTIEVEIKAKIENLKSIEDKLTLLNAIFKEEIVEEDHYFQHPCRNYSKTDEALRIRISKNKYFLTYKGPKIDKDTKSRAEIEISIEDPESCQMLLERLGFKDVGSVFKKRRTYLFQGCSIMLDSVQNLGEFIEIECFGDFNACKKSVFSIAKLLEIKNFERRSYIELLKQKN